MNQQEWEHKLRKKEPTDKELIAILKNEVRRVKIQRNAYEQELFSVNKKLNKVQSELTLLENYINRTKTKRE